ncbi:hypothetical protein PAHAL_7G337700 [Panicum hallii]|uniref:Uncharacterized protein n=1 Tax=Panicum hallii TaxID=206008 RepID=A0A2T8IEA9_9POAL|nr:hypothetical protein PAHAL_7G337700 [Panicum hallii]
MATSWWPPKPPWSRQPTASSGAQRGADRRRGALPHDPHRPPSRRINLLAMCSRCGGVRHSADAISWNTRVAERELFFSVVGG